MAKQSDSGDAASSQTVLWRHLADPDAPDRDATVTVSLAVWRHILTKHIRSPQEPWDDLLTAPVRAGLLTAEPVECLQAPETAAGLAALEWQVRESLARPLVLLFEVCRPVVASGRGRQHWCLVLPAGATAYVAARGGCGNYLKTCYFPKASVVERDGGQRWRRVVRWLVLRYAVWDAQRGMIRLPEPDVSRPHPANSPATELHCAIRFAAPAAWGFCPELDAAPWRGRLESWPAAEPPDRRSKPASPHRLKPRQRMEQGIDGRIEP